jgi:hypothetical protein
LEQQLEKYSSELGEKLERIIRPLAEPEKAERKEKEAAEEFKLYSLGLADRVVGMLDLGRDLSGARILILENGTGFLARRLAERDVDVVATAPTRNLARLAGRLNPYPSIIYKWFNPFPATEQFDIIIGTGILAFYPKQLTKTLLESLASFCKRKLIIELPLSLNWYDRLFQRKVNPGGLELTGFTSKEVFYLIENTCGMLISEHRSVGGKLLIKALKKAHLSLPL